MVPLMTDFCGLTIVIHRDVNVLPVAKISLFTG